MNTKIEKIATECALEALAAAGTSPTDSDGNSLLPAEPMEGDWEHLEEQLDDTDEDIRAAFEEAYSDHLSMVSGLYCDPVDPDALRAVLDHLVDSGAITTSSRNRGVSWLADKTARSRSAVTKWLSGDRELRGTSAIAVRAVIREALDA